MINKNHENDDFKSWKKSLRWPGVEPGSTAWKAAMLTAIPPTLDGSYRSLIITNLNVLTSMFTIDL